MAVIRVFHIVAHRAETAEFAIINPPRRDEFIAEFRFAVCVNIMGIFRLGAIEHIAAVLKIGARVAIERIFAVVERIARAIFAIQENLPAERKLF